MSELMAGQFKCYICNKKIINPSAEVTLPGGIYRHLKCDVGVYKQYYKSIGKDYDEELKKGAVQRKFDLDERTEFNNEWYYKID